MLVKKKDKFPNITFDSSVENKEIIHLLSLEAGRKQHNLGKNKKISTNEKTKSVTALSACAKICVYACEQQAARMMIQCL